MNLRDNEDGTCNCKPLGDGCFFTHPYDDSRPCDCKCHNTPDTEWEERFDKQFSRPLTQTSKNGGYEAREYIKIFIRNLLSSHTTYWKERVRKEVEGMKRKITFNGSDESGFIQYGQVIDSDCEYNQALDTLLDNLK